MIRFEQSYTPDTPAEQSPRQFEAREKSRSNVFELLNTYDQLVDRIESLNADIALSRNDESRKGSLEAQRNEVEAQLAEIQRNLGELEADKLADEIPQ
jgi:hypothetical protein